MLEMANDDHSGTQSLSTTPHYSALKIAAALAAAVVLHVVLFGASLLTMGGKPKGEAPEVLRKTVTATELLNSGPEKNGTGEKAAKAKSEPNGKGPAAAGRGAKAELPTPSGPKPETETPPAKIPVDSRTDEPPVLPNPTGIDDVGK